MCLGLYLVPLLLSMASLAPSIPCAELVSVPVVPVPLPVAQPVSDNLVVMGVSKQHKPDCPYCDSSVFPYCSDKLLHDACCCLSPQEGLPPQCHLADCSFLHANSCKEHRLITRCCCNRLLYIKR